LLLAEEFAKFY